MTKRIPVDIKNKSFYSFLKFFFCYEIPNEDTIIIQKQKPLSSNLSTSTETVALYIEKYIRRTT